MKTEHEIQRELLENDIEIENEKIDFRTWQARRFDLLKEQRHAESRARLERISPAPAPRAAPALTRADLDALFRPPQINALSAADHAELDGFKHVFDAHVRDQKVSPARDILQNPRRVALAQEANEEKVATSLRELFDLHGAKIFPSLVVGAVAVLRHELSETRLELRVLRAHCERLERQTSINANRIAKR